MCSCRDYVGNFCIYYLILCVVAHLSMRLLVEFALSLNICIRDCLLIWLFVCLSVCLLFGTGHLSMDD